MLQHDSINQSSASVVILFWEGWDHSGSASVDIRGLHEKQTIKTTAASIRNHTSLVSTHTYKHTIYES